MKQVVLLRGGVDSACGGIQGPLFDDGTFDFVCIPDRRGIGRETYGNTAGAKGRLLVDYFPPARRKAMAAQSMHLDPEFETFTYGDPTTPKRSLRHLRIGDYLVFYCGLQNWNSRGGFVTGRRPGLYLVGYFEVQRAGMARELGRQTVRREFAGNFHVRHRPVFEADEPSLVLVKGGANSRLFKKAHPLSCEGRDRQGRPLKVLSPEMAKVFGTFTATNSIQRSPPRWVAPDRVDGAIRFLKTLE